MGQFQPVAGPSQDEFNALTDKISTYNVGSFTSKSDLQTALYNYATTLPNNSVHSICFAFNAVETPFGWADYFGTISKLSNTHFMIEASNTNSDALTGSAFYGVYSSGTWSWTSLSEQVANNYTDYNSTGDYHVRVCVLGKMVVVSGEVVGTGAAGYIDAINLPSPFAYDANQEVGQANAVVFLARNQATGAYQQIHCGGNFKIYRESGMTNGQWYSFGFSYCKA